MSARTQLAAALKPLLPKAWKIIPYADQVDDQNTIVVILNQTRIAPNPAAPIASHVVTCEALIVSPERDPAKAETALDDAVDDFLFALDAIDSVLWADAEKVGFGSDSQGDPTNTAYRLNLTIHTAK